MYRVCLTIFTAVRFCRHVDADPRTSILHIAIATTGVEFGNQRTLDTSTFRRTQSRAHHEQMERSRGHDGTNQNYPGESEMRVSRRSHGIMLTYSRPHYLTVGRRGAALRDCRTVVRRASADVPQLPQLPAFPR
jgi:hypothetical protein